jgi:hypothetical protein
MEEANLEIQEEGKSTYEIERDKRVALLRLRVKPMEANIKKM